MNENSLNKYIIYSLIVHTVVITVFSLKWYVYRTKSTASSNIEVTLVSTRTKEKPINPDYIAQANNIGGGTLEEKNIPTNIAKPLFHTDELNKVDIKSQIPKFHLVTRKPIQLANKNNSITSKNTDLNSVSDSNKDIYKSSQKEITSHNIDPDFLDPADLQQISSLINKIDHRANLLAKRPKRRFVSASTLASIDAEYLTNWRNKIEYFGNKYYPEAAIARNLSGEVLLSVAVKSNGTIEKVKVEKSSGIKILDEAAVQTVHIAAPFPPFDRNLKQSTDIIEIVRTWRFNKNNFSMG
ncbi:MAG: energy transducer TonB [Gammaproteobacteria bacterium]|nr:energy transducer TonB [Gammaproteobacteria bacterium]